MSDITIETASFTDDRDAIYQVRKTVFVVEQRVPEDIEIDEFDSEARHVLAFFDGRPVGTGRVMADGRIGRMAVLSEYRGQGVGLAILHALIDVARNNGAERLYLSAQCHAIPFYERAGFVATGARLRGGRYRPPAYGEIRFFGLTCC